MSIDETLFLFRLIAIRVNLYFFFRSLFSRALLFAAQVFLEVTTTE